MSHNNRQSFGWILAAILLLLLLLLWFWFPSGSGNNSASQNPSSSPTGSISLTLPASRPTPADFLGHWTGKWDNTYRVQFTISEDADGKLAVLYEWEESIGRPLQRKRIGATLNGNVLTVGNLIELKIAPDDPNRATALGKFTKPRKSALVRQQQLPGASESPNPLN